MAKGRAALKRVGAFTAGMAVVVSAGPLAAGTFPGAPFCSTPPVAGVGVKPNLLLMLDNSASMYDLAYTDPAAYCSDDSYDAAKSYPGYFDENGYYKYDWTYKKFNTSDESLPAGCNAVSTAFLCMNLNGNNVDKFIARGRLLNWLAMSKLDLQKQVLTGGKFVADAGMTSGTMIPETRGCMGSRFVKIVPGATDFTFGIRGPVPGETDYRYGIYSGETRIEIYRKRYNKQKCLAAAADWLNGVTESSLREDLSACVGSDYLYEEDGKTASKGKVFIDIMSNCHAHPTNVLGDGTVIADCLSRVDGLHGGNWGKVPKGSGEDVCANNIVHGLVEDLNGMQYLGYLGTCYASGNGTKECLEPQAEQYCREITSRLLVDPTTGNTPRADVNVPAFIQEAGIYSLGDVSGVLRARGAVASAPSGLIQEYANDINLAAMIFNDNGASSSECKQENVDANNGGFVYGDIPCQKRCTGSVRDEGKLCNTDDECAYSCDEISPRDGGRIVSPFNGPVGEPNHSSGLIAAIDAINARSWTPLSEAFYNAIGYFAGRSDLRFNPADFETPLPAQPSCRRNNVLLVSDGSSSADRHPDVLKTVADAVRDYAGDAAHPMPAGMTTAAGDTSPFFAGSYNIDDLAWIARNRSIADFTKEWVYPREYVSTYVVYTGPSCGDYNADGTCKTTDEAIPEKIMQLAAAKGGGRIVNARDPAHLGEAFRAVLQQIASGSGTDAAVVSTGDGNGAVFLMEQYFPSKSFDGGVTSASWIGEMQGLWYYIDSFLGKADGSASTIREDSDENGFLDIGADKVVRFRSEAGSNRTYATRLWEGTETRVEIEDLKPLWRAGRQLWSRDLVKSPRTIYTPWQTGGAEVSGSAMMKLSSGSPEALIPFLSLTAGDPDPARLLKFVEGFDFPGDSSMRTRTVIIGGSPASAAAPGLTGEGVWKLGDIVSSTPQVQSGRALGAYHLPSPRGYGDWSYASFVGTQSYKSRGMVYVGANDGMLHAFRLGSLDTTPSDAIKGDVKAALTGSQIGSEEWAFVPKHALPYLKYLADPRYKHLFFVDGRTTLFDASIGYGASGVCSKATYWNCKKTPSTWRTVLIGGMGLGGASCDAADDATARLKQCVRTTAVDPADTSRKIGYSSYFALDVTDPARPVLLWEFSDSALGYSTTGPAIVRIGEDRDKNGRWFAVFGSGPTGPVDTAQHQFLGRSGQELQLFVVDLVTGELVATLPTGVKLGFAGVMSGGAIDADKWDGSYQDDAIYVGYTRADSDTITADTRWISGGVLRVLTGEKPPAQWTVGTVIDGTGPVGTGIARLQDRGNHNLWLYFGTGRYFFGGDDTGEQRALYGIKEPCYNVRSNNVIVKADRMDPSCTAVVIPGRLGNQTEEAPFSSGQPGWFINLALPADGYGAERAISTPTSVTGGAVFFSTFQPSTDPCRFGASNLWEVRYDTGGSVINGIAGKVLMQGSTGSVDETTLAKSGARKAGAAPGAGKPLPVTNSGLKPVRRIIHIQER